MNDNSCPQARVIDAMPIPVVHYDEKQRIIICNESFGVLSGESKDSIIGKSLKEVIHVEMLEVLLWKDLEVLDARKIQNYETELVYKNGTKNDVIINKSPMIGENGEVDGIVMTIIDITERRKVMDQLKRKEEENLVAYTLLQKIRAGIVIIDENMKIIDSNIGFARMFGEENEELFETIPGLKGAELDMLVPEEVCRLFESILETGESRLERDLHHQKRLLSIAVMTITKHKIVGAIIRDMSAPMLERAEIISRAKEVNRKNLDTVKQIAYLLGENAAQTEELLNSIIESQTYDDSENK